MGKSRLLGVARERAAELGFRVLGARATELEQGFPFGIVRQLFERPLSEADGETRTRWLAGAAALAEEMLAGAATTANVVLGPPASDPGYAWQHGLYWLASNVAADCPLALLVDDLQWCDALSARTLAFIARRVDGLPLALIVATRPLDPALTHEAAALIADPVAEPVHPSALTRAAIGELVEATLPGEPHERFIRACAEVTGGNPFLLGELLTEAAARGIDPTAAEAADVAAIVPSGVANAVLLRLARLPPAAALLARALSALGDGVQTGDVARPRPLGGGRAGSFDRGAGGPTISSGTTSSTTTCLGKDPPAFDILYWNQDSVRLAAGLHRDFVCMALDNALTRPGEVEVLGTPVDLGAIESDSYTVAGLSDHIVPWENAYRSTQLLGGSKRFVLSTSGHIQSLVNPPRPESRSTYRVTDAPAGRSETWVERAAVERGSWWPDYREWLAGRAGELKPAPRRLGSRNHRATAKAPGGYVHAS